MKIIFFISLLFTFLVSESQEKNNLYTGMDGISTTKGIFAYPHIGINLSKTKLQMGLLVGSCFVNSAGKIGFQGDFLFFPDNQTYREFNFYFVISGNYFKNSISIGNSETQTKSIQITFGYGFNCPISKKISFKSNVGIGPLIQRREFNFHTISPKTRLGFAGLISFGINYQL